VTLERRIPSRPGPKPEPIPARLARMSDRSGECWEWTGSLDADGYGQLTVSALVARSRKAKAHRLAYEAFVGPIPKGMHVLHRCDNRRCIRPTHLFIGDQRANMRDALEKGRHTSQRTAA
jgi:hypothetical protein